jgi:hypothetical protein
MASDLVNNYVTMLQSEERLFTLEKVHFLINSRESSLITAQLNAIYAMSFISNSELYKITILIK